MDQFLLLIYMDQFLLLIYLDQFEHFLLHRFLKPQSHRIVRLLDRTTGCDLANVRPIGNVCYDLQKHTAIDIFCWW